MDLSIIIVNWNSKDYLFKAIASVEADTKGIDFEMVVIDGGSFDGCAEMLRQVYPHIVFIQRDKNLGFAKANNEAFKVSRGRTLLFLNPDTEVEGHAVTTLYDQLNILPDVGMVGPKLLNSDRSLQQSCIRAFPTILNQVLESDLLRAMFPTSELWGMRPLLERDEKAKEVEAISGACLMIKKSVFEEVGMFSTDYFMYSEDIDLSLKVRRAGLKTYYVPTAVVVHHGGGSTAQGCANTFSSVMMLESRWRFFQKTRSVWYTRSYRLAMFITCVVRVGLVLFIWPIWRLRRKGSWGQAVLTKWMAKLRWTLGRESWVKDY
ncbi:MAG: glycosyltransferase family 2 protein [Nitrospira sp.]|nr:glycosyltransferase family 2 protein [Nitrospira sp.]MBX3338079.1 glycosyltransferase family 2 protein [Nitrospira sp.]MCW5780433.1 glycosyltransferase family 2 protein [Nitrospira sp.]